MTQKLTLNDHIQKRASLMIAEVDDDIVLLDTETGQYYGLRSTGLHIWELLEGSVQISSICSHLVDEYDIDTSDCQQETLTFLQTLLDNQLIDRVE